MNNITDQEISSTYKSMTKIDRIYSFTGGEEFGIQAMKDYYHKSYRTELFYRLLNGWNIEREKAGFKPLSPKRLATAINSNPFLKKDDGELELLIKECEAKGNYKKAQWVLFPKK